MLAFRLHKASWPDQTGHYTVWQLHVENSLRDLERLQQAHPDGSEGR